MGEGGTEGEQISSDEAELLNRCTVSLAGETMRRRGGSKGGKGTSWTTLPYPSPIELNIGETWGSLDLTTEVR